MIELIRDEIIDMVSSREYSNENDIMYYERRSNNLLDMLLGLGMEPPTIVEESFKILDSGEMTYEVRRFDEE